MLLSGKEDPYKAFQNDAWQTLYFIAVVHVPRDFYNSELGLLN